MSETLEEITRRKLRATLRRFEANHANRNGAKPKPKIQFTTLYEKNGQPKQVNCFLTDNEGRTHLGVARVNRAAGDIFLRKEGRRLARLRAECARDTHGTAIFRNGGICFAHDWNMGGNC